MKYTQEEASKTSEWPEIDDTVYLRVWYDCEQRPTSVCLYVCLSVCLSLSLSLSLFLLILTARLLMAPAFVIEQS